MEKKSSGDNHNLMYLRNVLDFGACFLEL